MIHGQPFFIKLVVGRWILVIGNLNFAKLGR